ncbi:hypothetical protein C9426_23610 [Serratia sp. S1B]|nr:hypothetical protein C9426_23610 [Serratia sp. S1B]
MQAKFQFGFCHKASFHDWTLYVARTAGDRIVLPTLFQVAFLRFEVMYILKFIQVAGRRQLSEAPGAYMSK